MYTLWSRLMSLRPVMCKMQKRYINIFEKIARARYKLERVQIELGSNKFDTILIEKEARLGMN